MGERALSQPSKDSWELIASSRGSVDGRLLRGHIKGWGTRLRPNGEEVQRNLTKIGSRRESFISSEPKLGSVFQSWENAGSV